MPARPRTAVFRSRTHVGACSPGVLPSELLTFSSADNNSEPVLFNHLTFSGLMRFSDNKTMRQIGTNTLGMDADSAHGWWLESARCHNGDDRMASCKAEQAPVYTLKDCYSPGHELSAEANTDELAQLIGQVRPTDLLHTGTDSWL